MHLRLPSKQSLEKKSPTANGCSPRNGRHPPSRSLPRSDRNEWMDQEEGMGKVKRVDQRRTMSIENFYAIPILT
jgi:hypothetical protein